MKKGLMVLGLFAAALLITPALSNHAAWGYDPYGVGIGGGGGNFIPPNISRVVPRNVPPARRAVPPRHADRPRPAHRTIYARAVNPSYHNPDLVKHYTSARRWRLVPSCTSGIAVRHGNRLKCWGCPGGYRLMNWRGGLKVCVKCPNGTGFPTLSANGRYMCSIRRY